jgi:MFS family permease
MMGSPFAGPGMARQAWIVTLAAAALAGLGMGGRQVFGIFVSPLNTASGLGLPAISLAMALGQLAVGLAQPLLGRWADRRGPAGVIVPGAVLLALATAMPAAWPGGALVFGSLLVVAIAGSAVGSNGCCSGP